MYLIGRGGERSMMRMKGECGDRESKKKKKRVTNCLYMKHSVRGEVYYIAEELQVSMKTIFRDGRRQHTLARDDNCVPNINFN